MTKNGRTPIRHQKAPRNFSGVYHRPIGHPPEPAANSKKKKQPTTSVNYTQLDLYIDSVVVEGESTVEIIIVALYHVPNFRNVFIRQDE